jgi:hypothetical protein
MSEVVGVGTSTLGFAVADADRAVLDELVEYFGHGNRSAYLRATLKIMRSVKLAEELRALQAFGQTKLAEQDLTIEDIPEITRRVLKSRS